jgi:hypothetical protein
MQYLQPTKFIWDRTVMFVLPGITLWVIALFMLSIDLEASAAALFLFGLAMMWPTLFYGKRGGSRCSGLPSISRTGSLREPAVHRSGLACSAAQRNGNVAGIGEPLYPLATDFTRRADPAKAFWAAVQVPA